MSIGQGKFLRAHQHKHHRKLDKTNAKIMSIKERMDRQRDRSSTLVFGRSRMPKAIVSAG